MADSPFSACSIAKQPFRREEEKAPATTPQRRLDSVDIAQHRIDLVAVRIEIPKPVQRRPLVVDAIPEPLLLYREKISEAVDKLATGHDAAGKEMLRDPIGLLGVIEPVGPITMGEDMDEHAPLFRKPSTQSLEKRTPIRHMFEHLDRDDTVEAPGRREIIHIGSDNLQIRQRRARRLRLNEGALTR